ncbi:MAG TPA: OsmC family protein [Candidatus Nitrosopolaris sp.]|nr:OsmC family protein [Candidatus Nitrosopolaris sp.]
MNSTKLNGVNTQQLGSLMNTLKANPDASKATFFVKTEWNIKEEGGGFCVRSSAKNFEICGQSIQRNSSYTTLFDFPPQFSGEGKGPTVCEACMSSLGACITQTIVAHATARGINLDSITIDLEGNIDLRGFTGISSSIRPDAQGFKVNVNIRSSSASKEQLSELYEIGKKFSPAFDTLTNGTSVIGVNSS